MQRRQFLKVAGFSTASLFFIGTDPNTGIATQILEYPSAVAVLSAGKWIDLTGSKEEWSSGPVQVNLQQAGPSLKVLLHAPGTEVEQVRLAWWRTFASDARYLGDDWERSYGELGWQSASPQSSSRQSAAPQSTGTQSTAQPAPQPTASLRRAPWYLLIHEKGQAPAFGKEGQTTAFGVKTGAKSFCYWQVSPQQLELTMDTHSGGSGVLLGDRTLELAEVITTQSLPGETPYQTDGRFCKMMCDKPVLPEKPVYGINDWYFAYGNNSKELILHHTEMMTNLALDTNNRPYSVIDDGWQLHLPKGNNDICWGDDFSKSNNKFGDMSQVTAEIKKLGMRPGLWTRPLLANQHDSPSLMIPIRNGRQDSKERYLDPTIPENRSRIAGIIGIYKEWGFDLVKHDYSTYDFFGRWGFEMKEEMTSSGWHFNDRSKTNAEILLELYQTIRKAAGNMLLIGCNTVSHLSAGIFDLMRTGDDTSGKEWTRTSKMGVNTLGFRLPQHNAFYAVDGDCVGLTTEIPWKKNQQWLQLLTESSAPLFISAQPAAIGEEQKAVIKKSFTLAARPQPLAIPLDWMTNPRPAKWNLNGNIVNFDWS